MVHPSSQDEAISATASQEKSHVRYWRSKWDLAPLMRPTKCPDIPVSLERNTEVFRQHFLGASSTLLIWTGGSTPLLCLDRQPFLGGVGVAAELSHSGHKAPWAEGRTPSWAKTTKLRLPGSLASGAHQGSDLSGRACKSNCCYDSCVFCFLSFFFL